MCQDILEMVASKLSGLNLSQQENMEELNKLRLASSPLPVLSSKVTEDERFSAPDYSAQALRGLRIALGKADAQWTSPQQEEATVAVLKCKMDVCVYLRTGAGKTVIGVIPALTEGGQITVVILPLKSLISDYKRNLACMKVRYKHYTGEEECRVSGHHGLILVSGDMARTAGWCQTIGRIHDVHTVQRLVYDEGHFALTSEDF
ncbi:hypothetical protein H0H87_011727 [Tephrocybe sp. NHM501043]|nr:hypothetical protein H0H87_011727 [Tephrocybe sp. NHM501043]